MIDSKKISINAEGIEKIIPHRGSMRLIDEIRDISDIGCVGVHYVKPDEFWCAGHFPGKPIMPGVLQIEALAQASCFMVLFNMNAGGTLGYFTTIEKAKFYHMVNPGDVLELHVELVMSKMKLYKFNGIAMVGGKKVSEASFTAIMDIK